MVLALVAAAVVLIEAHLYFKAVAVLNHAAQRGEQRCVYTRLARGTIVEAAASGRSETVHVPRRAALPAVVETRRGVSQPPEGRAVARQRR